MLRKQILLLGKQKMCLVGVKNIFASRTQILRLKHMFPSLATPGNIARNIVSATMFPSLARPLVSSYGVNYANLPVTMGFFLMFNDTLKSLLLPFSCFYSVTHCFPIFY